MQSLSRRNWPCLTIGQGQSRVTIWTDYDGPEYQMLHPKFQVYLTYSSGEEFWRVLNIYGHGGNLGHVTQNSQTVISQSHRTPDKILLQSALWFQIRRCLKMVEGRLTTDDWQRTTDDGGTMEHDHTVSSHAAFSFGGLKIHCFHAFPSKSLSRKNCFCCE